MALHLKTRHQGKNVSLYLKYAFLRLAQIAHVALKTRPIWLGLKSDFVYNSNFAFA